MLAEIQYADPARITPGQEVTRPRTRRKKPRVLCLPASRLMRMTVNARRRNIGQSSWTLRSIGACARWRSEQGRNRTLGQSGNASGLKLRIGN